MLIVRRDDIGDAGAAHADPLGLVERAFGRATVLIFATVSSR